MGEQKLDSDFGRNANLEDLSDDEDWVAAGDNNRVFHESPATAAAVESAKSASSASTAVDALLLSTEGGAGRGRGQGGRGGRVGRGGRGQGRGERRMPSVQIEVEELFFISMVKQLASSVTLDTV